MRTLIAEDNLTNSQLMLKMLETWGPCEVAGDGKVAVDMYRQALADGTPFELVCLDVMMPEMDGHEALAVIRQVEMELAVPQSKRAKVLMTSAVDATASMQGARASGCDGYLVKPIRKYKLYEALEQLGLITDAAAHLPPASQSGARVMPPPPLQK